ncbi:hypothetical protein [Reichenbachiella versicolor]|uniref:hypothetical protein n=1 Tax=Reichenbachiella versicolor TaxID=1821036 RepID=UPI000D6E2807|nr:hypothetical protein [Reichenbachiella versicolor]
MKKLLLTLSMSVCALGVFAQADHYGDVKFKGNRDNVLSVNGDNTANKPMLVIGEQESYGIGFKWNSHLNLDIVEFDSKNFFSTTSPTKLGHFGVRSKNFYWANNIGVGTETPEHNIHVKTETGPNAEVRVQRSSAFTKIGSFNLGGYMGATNENGQLTVNIRGYGKSYFNAGNVGIGVQDPSYTLEVHSKETTSEIRAAKNSTYAKMGAHGGGGFLGATDVDGDLTVNIRGYGDSYFTAGRVGIGTTTPDALLAVNGTIHCTDIETNGQVHCEEVLVDTNVDQVPDYVFEEDYDLRSLEETKSYIQANKHLPEVPSAVEMSENGMNLTEMNLLLLKKIEELTLHVISINEENQKLKSRLEHLESK